MDRLKIPAHICKGDAVAFISLSGGRAGDPDMLPYVDTNIIYDNPKILMGYSDVNTWMAVFANAGVRAYYGPNVLTPIGQPGKLDDLSRYYLQKVINEELLRLH